MGVAGGIGDTPAAATMAAVLLAFLTPVPPQVCVPPPVVCRGQGRRAQSSDAAVFVCVFACVRACVCVCARVCADAGAHVRACSYVGVCMCKVCAAVALECALAGAVCKRAYEAWHS